jgi:hypothetical protein
MSYFIIGGTNVFFIKGGTNVTFDFRWDKCHVLTIGDTKVGVAKKSGWHKCHVALMSVGQMSVGQMSVAQNSRHQI